MIQFVSERQGLTQRVGTEAKRGRVPSAEEKTLETTVRRDSLWLLVEGTQVGKGMCLGGFLPNAEGDRKICLREGTSQIGRGVARNSIRSKK